MVSSTTDDDFSKLFPDDRFKDSKMFKKDANPLDYVIDFDEYNYEEEETDEILLEEILLKIWGLKFKPLHIRGLILCKQRVKYKEIFQKNIV